MSAEKGVHRRMRGEASALFRVTLAVLGLLLFSGVVAIRAQFVFVVHDPGVRGGSPGVGGPIYGLSSNELALFNDGQIALMEQDSVASGLGPRFNMDSCAGCHAQPAPGGSSPSVNPQVAVATRNGATNKIPFFIALHGPVREARFPFNPDGSPDGGVHDLYTIAGRADAPGCNLTQPDFDAAAARNNLIFRIPTPVFGAGFVEAIEDSTIVANQNSDLVAKRLLGISGHPNRSGNDGTITRFGWKAQNKSVKIFASEAYNVEQGVTNEGFPNEREETPSCLFNGTPEDHTHPDAATPVGVLSDIERFVNFMRYSDQPKPAPSTPSIANGRIVFNQIGCAFCHTPTLMTGKALTSALSNKAANLYSDLLVHHMGAGLADRVAQGNAGPDEFRTAPLWGLGQRIFFLHDGRTSDLLEAIEMHASSGDDGSPFPPSEANRVILIFNALPAQLKQDVLNFLRSL